MFTNLIATLNENGRGLHAFQKCADEAKSAAKKDSTYSAEYLVLSVFAENFVEFHERMAIDSSTNAKTADRFIEIANQFDAAVASGEAVARLQALNEVSRELMAP